MKIFNSSFTHKSFFNLFLRILKILERYGLSCKKMESNMNIYVAILKKYGVVPTLPLTANVLGKHPVLIRQLADNGIEFAVHGYKHIDYSQLSAKDLSLHLKKAIEIFRMHNIQVSGWRFPYLKYNNNFSHTFKNNLFEWSSNQSILWDVDKQIKNLSQNSLEYQTMLDQYNSKHSGNYISLPRHLNGVLEIPVSLPDDDLLIDRLGISDEKVITKIWSEILEQTYSRGELFTLQLHPERISQCKAALEKLLKISKASEPKIWIASLDAICDWWKEKDNFTVRITDKNESGYKVEFNCSPRATLLVRSSDLKKEKFYNDYKVVNENTFWIKSQRRPVVGIPEDSPEQLSNFLKNEGIIFEKAANTENYSIYLKKIKNFSTEDEITILNEIHSTKLPLVRFWRWPGGCRSALSITGDIDALTSVDFFSRFLIG